MNAAISSSQTTKNEKKRKLYGSDNWIEMQNDNSVAAHEAHLSFYVFIINESMTRESPEIYLWIHFTFGFFFFSFLIIHMSAAVTVESVDWIDRVTDAVDLDFT